MRKSQQVREYACELAQDISNPAFSSSQELDQLLSEYVKEDGIPYCMGNPHEYRKNIAGKLDKIKALGSKYDQVAKSLHECLDLHPALDICIATGNHADSATAAFHDEVVEVIGIISTAILIIENVWM